MPSIIDTEVKDDGWAKFLRLKLRLDDGHVLTRQIEHHGEAAAVLPYDPQRRTALLVRLLRAPPLYLGEAAVLEEPVAGIIDPGESAEESARREAMEEVGVRLGALERIGRFWSSPGVSTERMTLFLAPYTAADRVAEGGGLVEEREDITVLDVPLAELGRRLDAGELGDMKLLALVQALKLRRPELF